MQYVGRFAPSPTGPLHFGSLVAAVGSYLQALQAQGRWLVRIEDVDTTREVAGAADGILRTLEALGFEWHGPVVRQSDRTENYSDALRTLSESHRIFLCSCSRSDIANPQAVEGDEPRYPGTCREGPRHPQAPLAVRLRVNSGETAFTDLLQGSYSEDVAEFVGDFVIKRRDGLHAYHLAVVLDDAAQGVTHVVRGGDLLSSTPRQILVHRALGLTVPTYCHLPLAIDALGKKLSKSKQSRPVDPGQASDTLWDVLDFLRQAPPRELRSAPVSEVWAWARCHWDLAPLKGIKSSTAPPPHIF